MSKSDREQRGLVIISALINFVDWLDREQWLKLSSMSEERAAKLRAEMVKDFLADHAEGENYFMSADQIAKILGSPPPR